MNNWQSSVREFHQKHGQSIGDESPGFRDIERRLDLVWEEVEELIQATEEGDFIEAVDALGDILYVVLGTAVSWGVDLDPIFDEIHKTNMAKPVSIGPGKVPKPPDWKPPRILELLKDQGYGS